MKTTTKGLVIREQTTGESDRLVTLLTADYGLVRAFVRRAKLIKSHAAGATSLFAYSDFLALAQYFAQLAFEMGAEEQPCSELLRLTLNSLHLLCKGSREPAQVKAVFELRSACLGGYMPSVLACDNCGTYETDLMYFDTSEGRIYCENCPKAGVVPVPKTVITAVRFICLTAPEKIFGFSLSSENLKLLGEITEKYTLSVVQRKLSALEFYKGLTG